MRELTIAGSLNSRRERLAPKDDCNRRPHIRNVPSAKGLQYLHHLDVSPERRWYSVFGEPFETGLHRNDPHDSGAPALRQAHTIDPRLLRPHAGQVVVNLVQ